MSTPNNNIEDSNLVNSNLIWFDQYEGYLNRFYYLKIGTRIINAKIIKLKHKIDINANKEERQDNLQSRLIEELKNKIDGLERKIDELITENTHLRVKIAKMEERLIANAKKRNQSKYKDE